MDQGQFGTLRQTRDVFGPGQLKPSMKGKVGKGGKRVTKGGKRAGKGRRKQEKVGESGKR